MRRLVLICILALSAAFPAATAQTPSDALIGTWEGAIDPVDLDLFVRVRFEAGTDGPTGTLDVPLQGANGMPLDGVEVAADGSVRFTAPTLPAAPTFEGSLDGDAIDGTFTQGSVAVPFTLRRAAAVPDVALPAEWVGTWSGLLAPDTAGLPMRLNVVRDGDSVTATLALPSQGLTGLEARPVAVTDGGVTLELPSLPADAVLGLRLDGDALIGTFQQDGATFGITFVREGEVAEGARPDRPQTPVPPFPYATEDVAFEGPAGTLAGTLALPAGEGPHPVVVLVNGSGAQDRDGTILGHAPMAVLADRLARSGVGSLRWDDRGVGGSEGDLGDAGRAGLVADGEAALRFLASRDDVDAERLGAVGHSEGGMIVPFLADDEGPRVSALVLLAAPAVPGLDVLVLQNRLILGAQGATEADIDAQVDYLRELATALEAGRTQEARALTRARAEVQLDALPAGQAPTGAARERLIDAQVAAAGSPTFADFVTSRPQEALRRVDAPTLAVYARLDVQVPAVQNAGAMRAGLRLAGVEDATVVTLPGLNHLLQPAGDGGLQEYGAIRTTLAPEVLALVSDWLAARLAP